MTPLLAPKMFVTKIQNRLALDAVTLEMTPSVTTAAVAQLILALVLVARTLHIAMTPLFALLMTVLQVFVFTPSTNLYVTMESIAHTSFLAILSAQLIQNTDVFPFLLTQDVTILMLAPLTPVLEKLAAFIHKLTAMMEFTALWIPVTLATALTLQTTQCVTITFLAPMMSVQLH